MAKGTVKWFNTTKGYGFIEPIDGGGDVFVHISVVEASGLKTLKDGQSVTYSLVTERGRTNACGLTVTDPSPKKKRPGKKEAVILGGENQSGKVKWYLKEKGYGFIETKDDSADVFVHISAVQAAGLDNLSDNTSVVFDLAKKSDGRLCAVNLRVAVPAKLAAE